jgi:hypothetical protein
VGPLRRDIWGPCNVTRVPGRGNWGLRREMMGRSPWLGCSPYALRLLMSRDVTRVIFVSWSGAIMGPELGLLLM